MQLTTSGRTICWRLSSCTHVSQWLHCLLTFFSYGGANDAIERSAAPWSSVLDLELASGTAMDLMVPHWKRWLCFLAVLFFWVWRLYRLVSFMSEKPWCMRYHSHSSWQMKFAWRQEEHGYGGCFICWEHAESREHSLALASRPTRVCVLCFSQELWYGQVSSGDMPYSSAHFPRIQKMCKHFCVNKM